MRQAKVQRMFRCTVHRHVQSQDHDPCRDEQRAERAETHAPPTEHASAIHVRGTDHIAT